MRGAVLLVVVAVVAADAAGLRRRGAAAAAVGDGPSGYTLPFTGNGPQNALRSGQAQGLFVKASAGAGSGKGLGYAGVVVPTKVHVR